MKFKGECCSGENPALQCLALIAKTSGEVCFVKQCNFRHHVS